MIRWSDKDTAFGPFTLSRRDYHRIGFVIKSEDDENSPAYGRLHLGTTTILWPMPGWLIKPYREKVAARYWDAGTIERLGRDWYWDVNEREYGFAFIEGALHVSFGRQTQDSRTDCSRCFFLPWKEWRHVRHSFYDMDGDLFCHVSANCKEREQQETACPVLRFRFADFDGEEIVATTRIEEREWMLGTGWFKWLSLIRKPRIKRFLDLSFSSEVGKRKGAWKGGTIGHSIEMLSGELHEAAFCRYCRQEGLKYIGRAAA